MAGPPQTAAPAGAQDLLPGRWIAHCALLMAAFMNLVDVTIVNVALPTLQTHLNASPAELEWLVAAYVLAFAVGLLPFGRLGDIVGRRQVFLFGVLGFTVFSVMCGAAPSIGWLIAGRVLQGLAAAAMMPQTLAIAQVMFPPQERGLAFSLFGLNAGMAAVAGPLVGGLLIAADLFGLDWRPIFLVNVPIGIIAMIAGLALIPNIPGHRGRIDWIGIPLGAIAVVCLVFPLVEGRGFGWPVWIFVMLAVAPVAATAFVMWQHRRARLGLPQLLPVGLLHNSSYMIGAAMTTALFSAMPSFFMSFAIFLQTGFGFTAFQSGYTTAPMPVGIFVASLVAGRIGSRVLHGRVAFGAVAVLIGFVWLRILIADVTDSVNHWSVAPALLVVGLGLGTAIGAMFQMVLATVPDRDAGSGSGALQSFQQAGLGLGVAVGGEIFFSTIAASEAGHHATYVSALTNEIIYQFCAMAVVLSLLALMWWQANRRGPKERQGSEGRPTVSAVEA